jgi:hypothetical protein
MSHDPYSPWPMHGERFRRSYTDAYAVVAPFDGKWPLYALRKKFYARWGRWWHFGFDFGIVRGYIGFKPINLMDAHFDVPEWYRVQPAVELSVRIERNPK